MLTLYKRTNFKISKIVTHSYSTSFSLGICMFDHKFHLPIYSIYGFVRYADEIVDTFDSEHKAALLAEFKEDTHKAIIRGISTNPILDSFQEVVRTYHIDTELIDAFLLSMEMDLYRSSYNRTLYEKYVYGSAEVVGLMCLKVFCENDINKYHEFSPYARSLGAAFQKVNFLRDIKDDFYNRGRLYFPELAHAQHINENTKSVIIKDIQRDFDHAIIGIKMLPAGARRGVYVAYIFYLALFKKLINTPGKEIMAKRIRINNFEKIILLIQALLKQRFVTVA
ncbi:MAG: phytoene/squalene synthase family protein [Cytophagales bacterium]|nr:phytoene/squalene synthase family protein [Cytophagales bacterium]